MSRQGVHTKSVFAFGISTWVRIDWNLNRSKQNPYLISELRKKKSQEAFIEESGDSW